MRTRFVLISFCANFSIALLASAAPSLPGNWNLSFDEEFSAPLNSSTWKDTIWGVTTNHGELQQYEPSGVSVANGKLSLTATKQTSPDGQHSYVSGLINTGPTVPGQPTGYSFKYGYAEASIKLVSGQGVWPAFWMLPDPNPAGHFHDQDGEIDIMEELGGQPNIDQVHYLANGGNLGTAHDAGVDLSQGFHTFAVNWQPGKIDYYLDGNKVWSVNQSPTVAEYLILNQAVGAPGTWAGAPTGQQPPASAALQVDYVRVWQTAAVPEPATVALLIGTLMPILLRRPKCTASEQ